jgi:hypothetical protein
MGVGRSPGISHVLIYRVKEETVPSFISSERAIGNPGRIQENIDSKENLSSIAIKAQQLQYQQTKIMIRKPHPSTVIIILS